MAYDQELADRIRLIIGADPALTAVLTEKKMFGSLAFLIGGHMAVAASGAGGVLVRVDPAERDRLTRTTSATVAVMGKREMVGWVRVSAADVDSDQQLMAWIERGTACARALPPKR
ncbi:MAG TPA: TfoX/Sxy family protein [Streptosporangiaceae bacterium]